MIATQTYRIGGRAPARVEEPPDAAGVAAVLGAATDAGQAVVAFGGGTLQSIGNAPVRFTTALSLRRLDRILQYDPRDLTIGVEAGITLAQLSRVLDDAGQFLPLDAPQPRRATIGGTLAAGWAGPRRCAYGSARDLLIGSTVALTDGSLANAGGMVVKNVTGYDMSKLYVGSLGTLGVIVRANFKALPQPAAVRIAVAPLSAETRARTLSSLAHLTIEPTAALVVDGFAGFAPRVRDEDARLFVLFEGSSAAIDRATRELRSLLGKCGVAETLLLDGPEARGALQAVIDASIEPVEDRSITYRHTGRPADVSARTGAARRLATACDLDCDTIADVRCGDAMIRISAPTADTIDDRLAEIDARLRDALPAATVLAGDPHLRGRVNAWGSVPSTLATQRALKQRFDPAGTLAPGRYVGGL